MGMGLPSGAGVIIALLLAFQISGGVAQDSDEIFPWSPDASSLSSSSLPSSFSSLSGSTADQPTRSRLRHMGGLFHYAPVDSRRELQEAAWIGSQRAVDPEVLYDLHNPRNQLLRVEQELPAKRLPTSGSDVTRRLHETTPADAARQRQARRKRNRFCDLSRITVQIIFEYLRTGRVCGIRVAKVRFGLGGRR